MKKRPFYQTLFRKCIVPNLLSALIILLYANFFTRINVSQIIISTAGIFTMILVAEFAVSPFTCKLLFNRFSIKYEKWLNEQITDYKERTALYLKVMRIPATQAIHTLCFFITGSLFVFGVFYFLPMLAVPLQDSLMVLFGCLFGAYVATIYNYYMIEKECAVIAEKMVSQGLDDNFITQKRFFGISPLGRAILFLLIPAVFVNTISLFSTMQTFSAVEANFAAEIQNPAEQVLRLGLVLLVNLIITIVLICFYFFSIKNNTDKLTATLTEVYDTGSTTTKVDSSLSDLIQYSNYILNKIVHKFDQMLKLSNQVGVDVKETSENLAVISKELTSTAMEQSADVKEILITMEDSNAFSKNIAGRTASVSAGTESTNKNIMLSFEALREVISQMDEIKNANVLTIQGIEHLKSQIDNIGDVVTLINDIADQTKIIAFNAELEAISAGDEGKNFHIVASEIRRLANSTTNSIHEIQEYIHGIQEASEKLIESSNNVTHCISAERELSHNLENQFTSIQSSSDLTYSKSSEISDIIAQQTSSFNQIVITLRQISAGIESFTDSTKVISQASINAQDIAQELNRLTK